MTTPNAAQTTTRVTRPRAPCEPVPAVTYANAAAITAGTANSLTVTAPVAMTTGISHGVSCPNRASALRRIGCEPATSIDQAVAMIIALAPASGDGFAASC